MVHKIQLNNKITLSIHIVNHIGICMYTCEINYFRIEQIILVCKVSFVNIEPSLINTMIDIKVLSSRHYIYIIYHVQWHDDDSLYFRMTTIRRVCVKFLERL